MYLVYTQDQFLILKYTLIRSELTGLYQLVSITMVSSYWHYPRCPSDLIGRLQAEKIEVPQQVVMESQKLQIQLGECQTA